jgi:hypothetical protein
VSDGAALPILTWEKEYSLLSSSVSESRRAISLQRSPATADRLRTLLTMGVTVLHYIGHGANDYIPFENSNGGVHKIASSHLHTLLTAGGGVAGLQLVFVNSCFSRKAGETFAECGVPHVVCLGGDTSNKGFLADDCAVTFVRGFYLALCSGKCVPPQALTEPRKSRALTLSLASLLRSHTGLSGTRSRSGRRAVRARTKRANEERERAHQQRPSLALACSLSLPPPPTNWKLFALASLGALQ